MRERIEDFKRRTPEELLFLFKMKKERRQQLFNALTDSKKLKGRNPKTLREMIVEIMDEELDICTALEEQYGLGVTTNSKGEPILINFEK